MKRITEVVYGNSAKINKGNYEQEAPFYSSKVIIESEDCIDEGKEFSRLRAIVDPLLDVHVAERKQLSSGIRVRVKGQKKYPSVTSVLHPDPLPSSISPDYGIRGTEYHKVCNHFIASGEWVEPSAPLTTLKYDLPVKEFFENHKDRFDFTGAVMDKELFHDKHLYSGESDLDCLVDGIPTLVDLKTGSWGWEQLMAYWMVERKAEQLAIFDLKKNKLELLNPKTQKAYEYWEKFLIKRGELKARFGL